MTESVQATLSYLADEFGYLEECQAGSTALFLQSHRNGQQGDLATQQLNYYSYVLPDMANGDMSACLPLIHKWPALNAQLISM